MVLFPFPSTARRRVATGLAFAAALAAGGLAAGLAMSLNGGDPAFAAEQTAGTAPAEQTPNGLQPERTQAVCERLKATDRKLTPDRIRDIVAGRLAALPEDTLKVGKVSSKSADTVSVDIVTKSGSLVVTREISTKTGLAPAVEQQLCDQQAAPDQRDGRGPGHRHSGRAEAALSGLGQLALLSPRTQRDLALTPEQARRLADAALVYIGNPRLKVGQVKEKDADTISIDIVTLDNALVTRRDIDRHTGRQRRPT
jgi:hypothetical protein